MDSLLHSAIKLVVVWTFDYALGHTLYNDLKARTLGQYQGTWNIITDVKDMWTEDNPNTDLSKYYLAIRISKEYHTF